MPEPDEYPIDQTMTEAQFTTRLVQAAKWWGWKVSHFRPAKTQSGRWSTPVQGHIGYPDVTLARDGIVIVAELKTNKGRLSPEQREWIEALGPLARVWRPRDWDTIVQELK